MTKYPFADVRRLVAELGGLDPETRATRLIEACAGKPGLREEVESLLGHVDGATEDLLVGPQNRTIESPSRPSPVSGGGAGASESSVRMGADEISREGLGQVGRYRIVRKVGAGGMGVVYEAEQDSPRRRVALKVLAPFGGPEAERRFELEGELLGRLQHPGIARVYESGTASTDGGNRAFLAMELVDGSDLMEHARTLAFEDQLRLVARIADAVEHAHQRGVIHRDLKPANVLVDRSGMPVVLDFGIARAMDSDDSARSMMTQEGMIVGTLAYMSPEQAAGEPGLIDTRTDVYALGAMAYEILSGSLPIQVGSMSMTEALSAVRERSPRPLREVASGVASDVATIVHCALQKDPEQRYGSAGALADDLRRFLGRRSITARPPSAIYELRQFVVRHRLPVSLVAIAILGVIIGLVRATMAERKAERRRVAAENSLADSEAMSGFLARLVDETNPINVEGQELTFREALDQAGLTMEEQLRDRPLVLARVHEVFGQDYDFVGELKTAEHHLRRAFEIQRDELGLLHLVTIQSAGSLARFLTRDGHDYEAALEFLDTVLPEIESRAKDYPHELAALYFAHGTALMHRGDFGSAEREMRRAVDAHAVENREHLTVDILAGMAAILRLDGRTEDAEPWLRRSLQVITDSHGANSHQASAVQSNLAVNLKQQGRLAEAEPLFLASLEIRRKLHGDGASENLPNETNYAALLISLLRYTEAVELLKPCVRAHREFFGGTHHNVGFPLYHLGTAQAALGRHAAALESFSEVIELWENAMGAEHPNLIRLLRAAGDQLGHLDRWGEAQERYLRGASIASGIDGFERDEQLNRVGISRCMAHLDDLEGAREAATLALEASPRSLKQRILVELVEALVAKESGDFVAAEKILRDLVTLGRADTFPESPELFDLQAEAHQQLAAVLVAQGRVGDAVELLEDYYPVSEGRLGLEHWRNGQLRSKLEALRSSSGE